MSEVKALFHATVEYSGSFVQPARVPARASYSGFHLPPK